LTRHPPKPLVPTELPPPPPSVERAALGPRRAGARTTLVLLALLLAATLPLSAQASLVILVRHAEKAAGGDDPGLTMEGWARAEALVKALSCVKLDGVITTRYQRTRLTAAPVVKAQKLEPVEVAASRDLTAHAAEVASLVNAMPAGSAVLIVGHSNTLGPIIAALGGPVIPELCDGQYDGLFFLDRGGTAPRLVRGHYGAADAPGADGCHAAP